MAVVARPVEETFVPATKVTPTDLVGVQSRFWRLPSALKLRTWRAWPWAAVRVPVSGAVENRSEVWR